MFLSMRLLVKGGDIQGFRGFRDTSAAYFLGMGFARFARELLKDCALCSRLGLREGPYTVRSAPLELDSCISLCTVISCAGPMVHSLFSRPRSEGPLNFHES